MMTEINTKEGGQKDFSSLQTLKIIDSKILINYSPKLEMNYVGFTKQTCQSYQNWKSDSSNSIQSNKKLSRFAPYLEYSRLDCNIEWKSLNNTYLNRDLVVTTIENHLIIHLFNIIEILNKFKIFKYHQIGKFINNIDLRKLDFLSEEKVSERSAL